MRRRRRGGHRAGQLAWLATLVFGPALAAAASPETDYMLQCQGCHRADGSGFGEGVPDLRDQIGRFLHVPGGREFLVRVPGSAQAPLSDAALAAVLNWMIERFGPAAVAADFRPYSAAEVAAARTPLLDVEGERGRLLAAMETRAAEAP